MNLGEKSRTNAKIEPKNSLIAYLTGSKSSSSSLEVVVNVVWEAEGKASITASARSVIKEVVQFRAGTRPQFFMPDSRAKCLYSMSISSSVSMCSLTKLEVRKKLMSGLGCSFNSLNNIKSIEFGKVVTCYVPYWNG